MDKLTVLNELLRRLQNGEIIFENQEEVEKHILDIRQLIYERERGGIYFGVWGTGRN